MKSKTRNAASIAIFICISFTSFSQQSGKLYNQIAEMDSLYFTAQNECDLIKYASLLSEDFEFFHDKAGFTASKDDELDDMAIFCGAEQRTRQPLRRELVAGSLSVYPMDNYGALQFANHVFYLQINDGTEKLVGSGKFTAVWKLIEDEWKLTRVISYDHKTIGEVELPDVTLEEYIGNYTLPDRIVNIKKEGNLLRVTDVIEGEPGWTKELLPEADNIFYLNYENVQYEFIKDKRKVVGLNIYENGILIEEASRKK